MIFQSLFVLLLLTLANSERKCLNECRHPYQEVTYVKEPGDCWCVCNSPMCFESADKAKCPTIKSDDNGAVYAAGISQTTLEITARSVERSFFLGCPTGYKAVEEQLDAAEGRKHKWPDASAANHPKMVCRKECLDSDMPAPGSGYTVVKGERCTGCEITLDYQDTHCVEANAAGNSIPKARPCKWSGKITFGNNGWFVHYKEGEAEPVKCPVKCKQPDVELHSNTGGTTEKNTLVCGYPNQQVPVYPPIPCFNGDDPELRQISVALLETFFNRDAREAMKIPSSDGATPHQFFAVDVEAVFFETKTTTSFLQTKMKTQRKKSAATRSTMLESIAPNHNENPSELILKCMGVYLTLADQRLPQITCKNHHVEQKTDMDTACIKQAPCFGNHNLANIGNGKNSQGIYESRDVTSQRYPLTAGGLRRFFDTHLDRIFDQSFGWVARAGSTWDTELLQSCQQNVGRAVLTFMGDGPSNLGQCIDQALGRYELNNNPNFQGWRTKLAARTAELFKQKGMATSSQSTALAKLAAKRHGQTTEKNPCKENAAEKAERERVTENTHASQDKEAQRMTDARENKPTPTEYGTSTEEATRRIKANKKIPARATAASPCNPALDQPCNAPKLQCAETTPHSGEFTCRLGQGEMIPNSRWTGIEANQKYSKFCINQGTPTSVKGGYLCP